MLSAGFGSRELKKRLLFISTIFPSKWGNKHAAYTLQILRALQAYYDIDVINPLPWQVKTKHRIDSHYVLDGLSITHPTYWYSPGLLRSYYGIFYYWSIRSCAMKLIKERRPEVLFSLWLYPDGWATCKLAKFFGIPALVKAIGTDANRLAPGTRLAKKTVETIAHSKKVICVSEALRDKLISVGANPSQLIVLYNGVDRNLFRKMERNSLRTELGYSTDDILILFAGNLLQAKGLDELADAFEILKRKEQFKRARLIVAGTGGYEAEFRHRTEAAGMLGGIIFMGSCALPLVAKLMNVADVVCLPSYSEGLPNVVLEALCCQAKIVATEVGGIPELARHHQNLYLVPPRDSGQLAAALATAIESKCSDDWAEDIGSWSEYAKKMLVHV